MLNIIADRCLNLSPEPNIVYALTSFIHVILCFHLLNYIKVNPYCEVFITLILRGNIAFVRLNFNFKRKCI